MRLTGIHHVTLTVTDLDRSVTWYTDVLGFQPQLRYRNDGVGADYHVLFHPQITDMTLTLRQDDHNPGGRFAEHSTGLDHLAFCVGDHQALAAWKEELDRRGLGYSVTDLPELSILVLRDPDNIQLELCTDIVIGEQSSIDASGHLRL